MHTHLIPVCYAESIKKQINVTDTDKRGDLTKVTVADQISIVQHTVRRSHVQVYGDFSIMDDDLGMFLGRKAAQPMTYENRLNSGRLVPQQEVIWQPFFVSKAYPMTTFNPNRLLFTQWQ